MRHPVKYACLIFFLLISFQSFGQVTPIPQPTTDTVKEFEIIRAPSMRAIQIDSATTLQTVAGGGVVIKQGGTLFHCDSAVVNPVTHILEAFGNIEINQGDTVHTFGEYLKYLGVEKTVHIEKNVKLTNNKGTLFTQTLDYNLNTGIGNFTNGGKVIDGKNIITSLEGTYYDDTKDIYFRKNVKLDGPKNHVRADSLLYNMQTRKSTFISQTHIKNPEVEINTTEGTYDLTTGNALFTKRTTVKDSSGRLYTANSMALEDKSGNAQMEGNAVIIDSAGGYIIIANEVFLNKKNNSFLATRKPVLIIIDKNDSTYVGADTIFSGFTNFVKNENEVLQKDSMINVNLKENEKVQQTLLNDSTPLPPAFTHEKISDSAKKEMPLHDTSAIPHDQNKLVIPDHRPPPQKDKLSKKTIPENKIKDSIPITDSLQKEMVTKEPVIVTGEVKDSLPVEAKIISHEMIDSMTGRPYPRKELLPNEKNTDSTQIDSTVDSRDKKNFKKMRLDSNINKKDSAIKGDTAIRYFLAFHHVKVYNDSLQSVSDSLFISSRDSVFRLYYNPVVWSGNTQINGDTIFLYTKNKKPQRMYVFESGLIVNRTREGFFNQMSGKTINGYFINGKIDYMRVKGSQSESIYYLQDDDSAYIGMNRATGDVIDLYFKDDDLKKVLFINKIDGKIYPMNQIPDDQKKLKIFQWLDSKRPKNKAEIFE